MNTSKSPHSKKDSGPYPKASLISIDYPRPLRIASTDGTLEEVRKILRTNKIGHKSFNPTLDSLKSKLLLEGVYEPNIVTKASDLTSDVMEFIKKNKNHLCENFTISDIYDAAMLAQEQVKAHEQEKKLRATKKGPSHEKLLQ